MTDVSSETDAGLPSDQVAPAVVVLRKCTSAKRSKSVDREAMPEVWEFDWVLAEFMEHRGGGNGRVAATIRQDVDRLPQMAREVSVGGITAATWASMQRRRWEWHGMTSLERHQLQIASNHVARREKRGCVPEGTGVAGKYTDRGRGINNMQRQHSAFHRERMDAYTWIHVPGCERNPFGGGFFGRHGGLEPVGFVGCPLL